MTQIEFITRLRNRLYGFLTAEQITNHITYYENFFQEQITSGIDECEVCRALGDPALIAKSIIDQEKRESEFIQNRATEDSNFQEENTRNEQSKNKPKQHRISVFFLLGKILFILLIVVLVFSLFSALLPFLLAGLLFYFVYRIFRNSSK